MPKRILKKLVFNSVSPLSNRLALIKAFNLKQSEAKKLVEDNTPNSANLSIPIITLKSTEDIKCILEQHDIEATIETIIQP